jgi:hypothetical protein
MHPEILRELAEQRGREMRARAAEVRLARAARRAMRQGHGRPEEPVIPAIPDFVDGSFLTEPTADKPAGTAGQVPTAGRAA